MSVMVVCECARRFELKDEFAGTLVECPNCGRTMTAGGTTVATALEDPIFGRDVYLLRQKALAINEKYHVTDEAGNPLLFVERPAHLLRGLLAFFAAIVAGFFTFALLAVVIAPLSAGLEEGPLTTLIGLSVFAVVGGVFFIVLMGLAKKRHISFFAGPDASAPRTLEILQNHKIRFPTRTFTVRDDEGKTLGVLSKNYLYNVFRKRWMVQDARGRPLCMIREDSIILSLLRRIPIPIFQLMRTNFVFLKFGSDRELGEFRRKRTILDRYVLDMKSDPTRILDRRLAIAAAVMLDTGERR